MTDRATTVDTHLTAYCEPDAERRLQLLASVWAADGVLIDPPVDGRGHDGISDVAAALLAQFPGHRFQRTTEVDSHHDHARYGWALRGTDGTTAVQGIDFVEFGDDGTIVKIVGFFGAAPASVG